jgi:hypothetical protein
MQTYTLSRFYGIKQANAMFKLVWDTVVVIVGACGAFVLAYAKQHVLTLRSIYTDADVSGVTLARPALQKLIADCRAGKIGTHKRPCRLSRDKGQLFALLHVFQTNGVRVQYSTGDAVFLEAVILSTIAKIAPGRR